MKVIDISEYSNAELEEMGIDPDCEHGSTYREADSEGTVWDVCFDCHVALEVPDRVKEMPSWW